jgi:ATP-binding cassette, subfamily B, bacterial IrtA/YbtP
VNKKSNLVKEIKARNRVSNILIAINVLLGIIPLVIVVFLTDMLINGTTTIRHILLGGILSGICLALKALFYGLSLWKAHDAAYGVLTDIRTAMIRHLKKLPLGFFQTRKAGDLANIINHDVEQVELYLAHALPEIMSATLIPAIIFVVVLLIDWRLGLALVCSVPLVLLSRRFLNKLWVGPMRQYSESTKKMSEDLLEYVATIPVIKAFSRDERKTKSVLCGMHEYLSWVKKWLIKLSVPMSVISMALEGGLVVMIIVGSLLLLSGRIGIREFILALVLGGIFSSSFAKLATFQHYGIVFNQSMTRIGSVMNVIPPPKGKNNSVTAGDILFQDVRFSYTGEEDTLAGINLQFRESSVNAIVGPSGSGKSTLAHLLMGFWSPDGGSISIGGNNIADMTEEALSSLVSIVQQEVFLFNLSIEENIRIGKPDATKEGIVEAAKRARIHEFIMELPDGYDTLGGEAGVKFSGGEKQRISIARMMLKNAPIIILDEATAAIDPSNELLIQKAIKDLGSNKTIITIAHHLNTIRGVDQIVVMDKGRIVASGEHNTLLAACPLYAEMTEQQDKVDSWQIKEVMV